MLWKRSVVLSMVAALLSLPLNAQEDERSTVHECGVRERKGPDGPKYTDIDRIKECNVFWNPADGKIWHVEEVENEEIWNAVLRGPYWALIMRTKVGATAFSFWKNLKTDVIWSDPLTFPKRWSQAITTCERNVFKEVVWMADMLGTVWKLPSVADFQSAEDYSLNRLIKRKSFPPFVTYAGYWTSDSVLESGPGEIEGDSVILASDTPPSADAICFSEPNENDVSRNPLGLGPYFIPIEKTQALGALCILDRGNPPSIQ